MSKNIVVIVGAIAGAKGITLYHADGKETNLALEGWKTKAIMDKVTPFIAKRQKVEIDLDTYDVHAHIEQKSGGLIRFVREKVASVRSWFKPAAEDEASKNVEAFTQTKVVDDGQYGKHTYGVRTAAPEEEVVVAIIGDKKVPGVEALNAHMEHAIQSGDTEGIENFMKRCASVIDTKGHSIQELLNFMRKGDLPIAKDGSIIAYKVLETAHVDGKQVIVDSHSKKVIQRVGSLVCMDPQLVDPSRRTQCSSGLHIARRGYLNNFPGDKIMLVKVAPEDVIAVPMGEPNKMRVAAYHIIAEIPASVHAALRSNQPMTKDNAASKLLADALAGNHVPVLEEVRIGAVKGGNLKITPLVEKAPEIVTGTSGEARALDDEVKKPAVTIQELRLAVQAAAPDAPPPDGEITKSHVQMIDGDLHVDGKKVDIEEAAMSGDMSAAINAKPEKVEKAKKLRSVATKAIVENVLGQVVEEKPLMPQKHADAIRLHGEGKSNRAIEAELHICRKTLKKLFDKHGLKPNG
ncbi:rIIB protector from prophage-induced early lysis protein [Rhizobium phage RHph_Y2_17_1]|nr:rIIB protector from prophage-induced early lysis protein [Rhizobium phage RHph_Y2_11]QIG75861.1 rIIB protector from prophage-induced early lysis protein [Rhizobium phage RHph_Y2_17_1]